MYAAIKHLHITCVILSFSGFFLRGMLMLRDSPLLERRWIKIAPHINDTVLIAAALGLMTLTGQYPFVDSWLTAKVFGLIAYIILGLVALKAGRTKAQRTAGWIGALTVFGWVASVALMRNPRGFFALI
jgi:uncharacterized membrane protein SirB2